MSNELITFLSVVIKNGLEPIQSWESISKDPNSFVEEIAKRLAVKGVIESPNLVFSPTVPGADERSKIWVKTSKPFGIGILIEGGYQMDYGMTRNLPTNVPFIGIDDDIEDSVIPGVSRISSTEVEQMGLPKLATGDAVTKKTSWYIFKPQPINF